MRGRDKNEILITDTQITMNIFTLLQLIFYVYCMIYDFFNIL